MEERNFTDPDEVSEEEEVEGGNGNEENVEADPNDGSESTISLD